MEIWDDETGSSTRRDEIMPYGYGSANTGRSSSSSSGGGWSPGVQHSGMPTRQTTTTTGGGWTPGVQHSGMPKTKQTITTKDTKPSHLGLGRYIKKRPNSYLEQFNQGVNNQQWLMGKLGVNYPKFFQLDTLRKLNQARNMPWSTALGLEKQTMKNPFGYGYKGKGAAGMGKYALEGIKSLIPGGPKWNPNIGGATPLVKKAAVFGAEQVLPRVMGGLNVAGAPLAYAQAAGALQNRLASQGLTGEGGIADTSGGWGAEAAGADVEYDFNQTADDQAFQASGAYNPLSYYLGGLAHLLYGGLV